MKLFFDNIRLKKSAAFETNEESCSFVLEYLEVSERIVSVKDMAIYKEQLNMGVLKKIGSFKDSQLSAKCNSR